jgi:hypothetical protein
MGEHENGPVIELAFAALPLRAIDALGGSLMMHVL